MPNMKENLNAYLTDYLEKGYATHEFEVVPGKLKATIKTITIRELLELESAIKSMNSDEVLIYKLHMHQIEYLARTLIKVGGVDLTVETAKDYLLSVGSAIVDRLKREQDELENLFRNELKAEDIENFTPAPSTATEPSSS